MKAAFFDVDGTLTENRVWNGLMDYFRVNRIRLLRFYLFNFYHYGLYFVYWLGLLSQVKFRAMWAENLSWLFGGFSLAQAEQMWDWVVIERINAQWRPDTVARLRQHQAAGDVIFLVSGGPVGLLERIGQELGVVYAVGTQHAVQAGYYTGKPASAACQGQNKVALVKAKAAELGLMIDFAASFAYADSLADVPLLEMVGNPVAVCPDEKLAPVVAERGWQVLPG